LHCTSDHQAGVWTCNDLERGLVCLDGFLVSLTVEEFVGCFERFLRSPELGRAGILDVHTFGPRKRGKRADSTTNQKRAQGRPAIEHALHRTILVKFSLQAKSSSQPATSSASVPRP